MTGSLLVLAPHPDDEILGAGAIMARTVEAGDRVAVVVLTDGSRSHSDADPAALAESRRHECSAGLATMVGADVPVLFLDQPDGFLSSTGVDLAEGAPLAQFVAAALPDTIFVTDPADGHPDHKAAFGLATRLVAAGYATRLMLMPVGQRVDDIFDCAAFEAHPVGPLADRKMAALACHRSQVGQGGGFTLSSKAIVEFCETEYLRMAYNRDDCQADAVPSAHFDAMFTASPDPWSYDTEPYERDRFDRTVAALEGRRYRSALELGCANAALTERIAPLCDELLATDVSEAALQAATARLARRANVTLQRRAVPAQTPAGPFDLIVASDLLYYLGLEGVVSLMTQLDRAATPDCRLLIASYLGETDTRLTGEMSSEAAIAHLPDWKVRHAERTDRLRIDVLERR